MKHKIFKRILLLLLLVLAVIICFPVVFLIVGSLMGTDELNHYLGAVLGKADGFASWALLPTYPTFKAYVQLLLDSPEFFVMFWNSVKMTGAILLGQIVTGVPAAWGFARLDIPGKKVLFNLYIELSDTGCDASGRYAVGRYFAGRIFHIPCIYYVSFLQKYSEGHY